MMYMYSILHLKILTMKVIQLSIRMTGNFKIILKVLI